MLVLLTVSFFCQDQVRLPVREGARVLLGGVGEPRAPEGLRHLHPRHALPPAPAGHAGPLQQNRLRALGQEKGGGRLRASDYSWEGNVQDRQVGPRLRSSLSAFTQLCWGGTFARAPRTPRDLANSDLEHGWPVNPQVL